LLKATTRAAAMSHVPRAEQRLRAGPVISAISISTAVILPSLLVGSLGVLIQVELGFGEAALGLLVSGFFVGAAASVGVAGWLSEAWGIVRTTRAGIAAAGASLAGISFLAGDWGTLLVLLVLGGIGEGISQIGVNLMLARQVPRHRLGLVFGLKQGSIPLASVVAGAAVPLVGVSLGWRWAFILSLLLLLGAAASTLWRSPLAAITQAVPDGGSRRNGPLAILAVGVGLASAGGTAATTFLVAASIGVGLTPAEGGTLLAAASLAGVVTRVAAGWIADRIDSGALLLAVALMALGVAGYLGLALAEDPSTFGFWTAVAFIGGWGFPGLIPLSIVRLYPSGTGPAMGIVQVGPLSGAVLGPLVFGVVAETISIGMAWIVMGALTGLGGAVVLGVRSRLLIERSDARGEAI
jgi:MFS family permease